MTVVQAYICAKHYQVTWWSLWLAYWVVNNNGRPVAHRKETYSVTTFVSAGSSRSSQDPRPGGQREGARHSGHLRQLLILLRCAGLILIKTFLKVFTELVRTALTNLTSTFLKYVQGFSSKYGTKLLETVSVCWLHKRTIFDWKRLFLTLTFGSR